MGKQADGVGCGVDTAPRPGYQAGVPSAARHFGTALALILPGLCGLVAFAETASEPTPNPAATASTAAANPAEFRILYPFDGTLFPPDLAPPLFRWQGTKPEPGGWPLSFQFQDGLPPLSANAGTNEWRPDAAMWQTILRRSREKPARFAVRGAQGTEAALSFRTSPDEVGASIFYRDVNLPFIEAVKDPSDIRWRLGSVGSTSAPPVVLAHLPVCGNCHSFSANGEVMGMDVDYANSKASYAIARTAPEMRLTPQDVITWDDFRREDGEQTFGLLSQLSPDGRWVVSTVKDKSVFVPMPELAFSQLFFPIKGLLAVYNRETKAFASLPGADDPAYVQSNPAWSPDGRYLVFARAKAYNLSYTAGQGRVLLTPEECREFTRDGKPFRFELCRLPFNDGRGGVAEPLAGASDPAFSYYFPKYSPDGRWIVFCRARSYMLLRPDSELFIMPAAGGEARRLRGNLARMNSWHSWSPNGRWLVFSSKAFSDYTQLFLTHIDAEGESTPPVWLEHFSATNRAANIPEFLNLPPGGLAKIEAKFLNDYSFERAGNELYRSGDVERAIERYRQALELNPANVTAHQRLGFLYYHVKKDFKEGIAHTTEALRLDPKHSFAHGDMGVILLHQAQPAQAVPHFLAALQSLPAINPEAQYQPQTLRSHLGKACLQLSRFAEAATHWREAVRLAPGNAEAHYLLALSLACQGVIDETVQHLAEAVKLRPAIDTSVRLHELLAENYAKAGQFPQAVRSAEHALELARAAGKNDLAERIATRLVRLKAGVSP